MNRGAFLRRMAHGDDLQSTTDLATLMGLRVIEAMQ